jgi:flagellar operon protein
MIKPINSQPQVNGPQQKVPSSQRTNGQFADLFRNGLEQAKQESLPSVAFSKHAMTRAEERGIQIDETLLTQLSDSVEKAQAKGAKNILAFDSTRAFIVNVPHGRVITAMSQEEMKENIFTNIDGAVIL